MSMLATLKFLLGKKVITAYFMEMQLGLKKKGILGSPSSIIKNNVSQSRKLVSHPTIKKQLRKAANP